MIEINSLIATELGLKTWQIENALALREEGGTLPFIARYRKEKTGELTDTHLRDLFDRADYLNELEERKLAILESIDSQGKLTPELRKQIEDCLKKNILEDLYLPYKPKKRTKATIAREKGLEPLAIQIREANQNNTKIELKAEAEKFINLELEVKSGLEAITGASDILAEELSENVNLRNWVREFIGKNGIFITKIKAEFEVGSTKFEMYRDFQVPISKVAPHQMLAMRRAEAEKILSIDLKFEESDILNYLEKKEIISNQIDIVSFYTNMIKDSYTRLFKNSLIGELRLDKKVIADVESVKVFENNVRQMLLSAPAGMKPTMGIDPGFRTGCKVCALDNTGKYMEYKAIFPFNSENEKINAEKLILDFIKKYNIELIAIGNGTASRETDEFVEKVISKLDKKPIKVTVSEAGASIYSASEVAVKEFPDLDVTVRGAISIARRLQDPLAELVKIDPKSIGVGQYQHDVDQKLIKKRLDETVESCVNFVGVDLNTASKELLTYVSGLNTSIATNIIDYRNKNGAFKSRRELMKVAKLGDKAFELSAGFLRIKNGSNPLDNTAVHPESYKIVEQFASDLQVPISEITKTNEKLKTLNLKKYVTEAIGEPTLKDILSELEKPGRDPREEFKYASFNDGIKEIKDLRIGMELEGVVTNITNFGAFVDIGVHQDGLVHISEIANGYVKEPTKILKVGQIVNVMVTDVNEKLKRVALSIKQAKKNNISIPKAIEKPKESFSLNDLKGKFGK